MKISIFCQAECMELILVKAGRSVLYKTHGDVGRLQKIIIYPEGPRCQLYPFSHSVYKYFFFTR